MERSGASQYLSGVSGALGNFGTQYNQAPQVSPMSGFLQGAAGGGMQGAGLAMMGGAGFPSWFGGGGGGGGSLPFGGFMNVPGGAMVPATWGGG
jgi:hypothetical protein